jgi:DNA-binding transcriptional MerR regulator/methylmalonyl-CoA mutase cobalamin-binding subunit
MMSISPTPGEPRHPIGVVSSRSGIAQDVLRAWERRYGAVVPHRSATRRRLYSDDDIRRFRLLKQLVDCGRRISDVATLPADALEHLVAEDREAAVAVSPRAPAGARDFVQAGLEAGDSLDAGGLRRILADASVAMSPASLRDDLICTLLRETGRRWRKGELRIAQEHLVTAVVRSFVGAWRGDSVASAGSPCILIATPSGQRHEMGALLAAVAAEEVGWRAIYLGPDLLAEEIAAAAQAAEASAVGLSLVGLPGDSTIHEELRRVRSLLGDEIPIFTGGDAAGTYGATLRKIGATRPEGLGDFQEVLAASSVRGARSGRR